MEFSSTLASNYASAKLVELLNRGFEGYVIPIHFTTDMFFNMLRKDSIDLAESRVLLANKQECGIALIAPRRSLHASRVAAMGIVKEARGKGAGTWLMKQLVDDARARGEREMVLEVIEENDPAIKLYRNYGFENMRRLVGYIRRDHSKDTEEKEESELQSVDLYEMGRLISQYGLPDLPWQLSGESISQTKPPLHAFREGQAYIALSNPEAEHVVIWSLLVEPEARGHRLSIKLLKRVMALHLGKTWHVPAVFPEELGVVFERAGFEKEMLSQWQMKLKL
ncbi:MAG TPA: GNAT family N-acetyltransferase [Anaerolineales bacterium]|jgi:ribosomal protein S18 acetylase RimI-like enzyme|nr:GNAT family N-acetyltransferase [Anaerolineales bacterium]